MKNFIIFALEIYLKLVFNKFTLQIYKYFLRYANKEEENHPSVTRKRDETRGGHARDEGNRLQRAGLPLRVRECECYPQARHERLWRHRNN